MDLLMLITLIGITVAGLATILAIWMERDPRRPAKFALSLSILILLATGVMILQSILDAREQAEKEIEYAANQEKLEGDLARMLQKLDSLASKSDDPEVVALLSTELEAQARSNPEVVKKLAQRFSDEGEDPSEKLGKHLKSSEVEKLKKKGTLKVDESGRKKVAEKKAKEEKKAEAEKKAAVAAPAAFGAMKLGGEAAKDDEAKAEGEAAAAPARGVVGLGGLGLGGGEAAPAGATPLLGGAALRGDAKDNTKDAADKAEDKAKDKKGSKSAKGKKEKKDKKAGISLGF